MCRRRGRNSRVLLSAWAGFGLFTIACGTLIALYADRLSHRRRHVVLTGYFEHVLELPLTYHGNTHSGRLMKVMLQGTDALWGMWVGFFRDHLASFISLAVLLPISLFINWRLASLLIVLCVIFAALTALIVRKTGSCKARSSSIIPIWPSARPTRWAILRWCRAFRGWKRKSSSCARSSSACWPRKCRCFRGGRWPWC